MPMIRLVELTHAEVKKVYGKLILEMVGRPFLQIIIVLFSKLRCDELAVILTARWKHHYAVPVFKAPLNIFHLNLCVFFSLPHIWIACHIEVYVKF